MHPRIELVATSGCTNFVHLELVTYKLRACNQGICTRCQLCANINNTCTVVPRTSVAADIAVGHNCVHQTIDLHISYVVLDYCCTLFDMADKWFVLIYLYMRISSNDIFITVTYSLCNRSNFITSLLLLKVSFRHNLILTQLKNNDSMHTSTLSQKHTHTCTLYPTNSYYTRQMAMYNSDS